MLPVQLLAVVPALIASALPPVTGAETPPHQYVALRLADDGADARGPLDIVALTAGQRGAGLLLRIRTRGAWSNRVLVASGRSVCFQLSPLRSVVVEHLCLQAGAGGRLTTVAGTGRAGHRVLGVASRPDRRSVQVRIAPTTLALPFGRIAVSAETTWSSRRLCSRPATRPSCADRAPDTAPLLVGFVRVRPVGCGPAPVTLRGSGGGHRKVVALTFDDGPGPSTGAVEAALEREHVPATFFLIGREISAHGALLRRMVAAGQILGDHTWSHADVAGGGRFAAEQIEATHAALRAATGFTPCMFRAPYGDVSAPLVRMARALGMATIGWTVDPRDWSSPGAAAIVRRVLAGTRPGSIILLHDGGGQRGGTVAALPRIVRALRRRGYSFAMLPSLLGIPVLYAPR